MNIEPDSIVLPRLIPWLAESRFRLVTSEILLTFTSVILIYVWVTRFFSPTFFLISFTAAFIIIMILLISYQMGPPEDEQLRDEESPNFCPDCGVTQFATQFCQNCGRKHF